MPHLLLSTGRALLGPGRTFSPSGLTGLQSWLKTSVLALSDSTLIATFTDNSGQSHEVSQSTDSKKFTYKANILNGQPIARMDGGDIETSSWSPTLGTGDFYIIVAAKVNSATGAKQMLFGDLQNSGGFNGIYLGAEETTGKWKAAVRSGGSETSIVQGSATTGVWKLIEMSRASGTLELVINGSSVGTATASGTCTGEGFTVGEARTGDGGEYFTGDMAELCFYSIVPNSTEKDNLRTYYNSLYAIY